MNNLVIEDSSSDSEYETSSSEENYGELINNNWMPDRPTMPNMPNLYNSEFKTINILVDTSTICKSTTFNSSDYVYHLNLTDFSSSNISSISENNTGGFDKYTGVIGFRLVNAIILTTNASSNYVDIVVEEIPYIACKHNSHGRRIIDRVPLDNKSGECKYYEPMYRNIIDYSKLFFPITLDKLTIKLYNDSHDLFDEKKSNLNIEFELTLKN